MSNDVYACNYTGHDFITCSHLFPYVPFKCSLLPSKILLRELGNTKGKLGNTGYHHILGIIILNTRRTKKE